MSGQCIHNPALYWYQCQECSEIRGEFGGAYHRTKESAFLFVLGAESKEILEAKKLLTDNGYRWLQPVEGESFSPEDLSLKVEEVRVPSGVSERGTTYKNVETCVGVEKVVFLESSPQEFPEWQETILLQGRGLVKRLVRLISI